MQKMYLGLVVAVFFVGFLTHIPQRIVTAFFGKQGTVGGIARATVLGVLLDLCSHGILIVAMNLYKKGVSLGQIMAFLIASPWNSFSLTIILISLVGWSKTLLFIGLSLVVAFISGLIFWKLVEKGVLPKNQYHQPPSTSATSMRFWDELKKGLGHFNVAFVVSVIVDGIRESRMVLRWLFVGVILVSLIEAFADPSLMKAYFGPTIMGLLLTTVAATVIEVCSEGSVPIASYLVNQTKATGNAFTFLMAGVSTDYTEVMSLKDTTKSWKIALFLPLVTLPQILLLGYLLNMFL